MSNRFRLGIVLRLREMAEETARIELGHALDAHQRAVAAVEAAHGRAGEELRWLSNLQSGMAEAGQLQTAVFAVTRLGHSDVERVGFVTLRKPLREGATGEELDRAAAAVRAALRAGAGARRRVGRRGAARGGERPAGLEGARRHAEREQPGDS